MNEDSLDKRKISIYFPFLKNKENKTKQTLIGHVYGNAFLLARTVVAVGSLLN